jgi:hypothetical protein
MDSSLPAHWLAQKRLYICFQIVVVFSNSSCFYNKCIHFINIFDAYIWSWSISGQCQNILTVKMFILPSQYKVKYSISYQILLSTIDDKIFVFGICLFDSLSNFRSAHDESLKPLIFPSSVIQKIIQQCFQTIKLFRNAESNFYFSFFSSFLHDFSHVSHCRVTHAGNINVVDRFSSTRGLSWYSRV